MEQWIQLSIPANIIWAVLLIFFKFAYFHLRTFFFSFCLLSHYLIRVFCHIAIIPLPFKTFLSVRRIKSKFWHRYTSSFLSPSSCTVCHWSSFVFFSQFYILFRLFIYSYLSWNIFYSHIFKLVLLLQVCHLSAAPLSPNKTFLNQSVETSTTQSPFCSHVFLSSFSLLFFFTLRGRCVDIPNLWNFLFFF